MTFHCARRRLAGVLLLLAALAPVAASAQRPVHVDPLLLNQYVGRYRLSPTYVLTILVENDRLYVRAPGRGARLLVPASETEFIEVESGLRIEFRIRAASTTWSSSRPVTAGAPTGSRAKSASIQPRVPRWRCPWRRWRATSDGTRSNPGLRSPLRARAISCWRG